MPQPLSQALYRPGPHLRGVTVQVEGDEPRDAQILLGRLSAQGGLDYILEVTASLGLRFEALLARALAGPRVIPPQAVVAGLAVDLSLLFCGHVYLLVLSVTCW